MVHVSFKKIKIKIAVFTCTHVVMDSTVFVTFTAVQLTPVIKEFIHTANFFITLYITGKTRSFKTKTKTPYNFT